MLLGPTFPPVLREISIPGSQNSAMKRQWQLVDFCWVLGIMRREVMYCRLPNHYQSVVSKDSNFPSGKSLDTCDERDESFRGDHTKILKEDLGKC